MVFALVGLSGEAHSASALAVEAAAAKGRPPAAKRRLSSASVLQNGSFETSLAGWYGYNASLSLVEGAGAGARAARVTARAASFSILTAPRPVSATIAKTAYRVRGLVRGRTGRRICLRVREWSGSILAGSRESCVTASSSWARFPDVAYSALGSGRALDVYVYATGASSGETFDVDALQLLDLSVPASFGFAAAPTTLTAAPGATVRTDVVVSAPLNLEDPVALSVTSVPRGWAATLATTQLVAPGRGALTVSVPASATPATYTLTISASGEETVKSATLDIVVPAPVVAAPPTAVTANGVDNAHVRLAWPAVSGASAYRVLRNTLLVGRTSETTFTDALLWPGTAYQYVIEAVGSDGSVLDRKSVSGTTKPLSGGGFPRPYSEGSIWNRKVGASPTVHPRSAAMIDYLVANARNPNFALRAWNVAVAEAHPSDPLYQVPCWRYRCSLDAFGGFRIPLTAQPDPSTDGHLVVYDPETQREWSMSRASRTDAGGWQAAAGGATSMLSDWSPPPEIATGNAANFPLLGGIVRPEEILQGRIDHALVFAMPGVGAGAPVCPASHNAGSSGDPNALREGQKLQLDPSLDIDAMAVPAWQKTLLRAMQQYGLYLRDGSGSLVVYGENPIARGYDAWAKVGFGPSNQAWLTGLPWSKLRVLDARDYPACG